MESDPHITPSTAVASPPGLKRAQGLWFEDCGLIIQAEKTLFRVSRDILAAQSSVFHDMLSIPSPKDADTMFGCPFVALPDDADDVDCFLRAIFYYHFFEPFPASTTFAFLSSVLRMSHKYDAPPLRKRALVHLSSANPTTLLGWELLGSERKTSWALPESSMDIDTVRLARQLSADWILPATFYKICENCQESSMFDNDPQEPSILTHAEQVSCVTAIRYLETTAASEILDFLWSDDYDLECAQPLECQESRHNLRRRMERRRKYVPGVCVVMPLELWTHTDWGKLDVCLHCLSAMKLAHQEAKRALWDELPGLFGLPDWAELERMKAEALA